MRRFLYLARITSFLALIKSFSFFLCNTFKRFFFFNVKDNEIFVVFENRERTREKYKHRGCNKLTICSHEIPCWSKQGKQASCKSTPSETMSPECTARPRSSSGSRSHGATLLPVEGFAFYKNAMPGILSEPRGLWTWDLVQSACSPVFVCLSCSGSRDVTYLRRLHCGEQLRRPGY